MSKSNKRVKQMICDVFREHCIPKGAVDWVEYVHFTNGRIKWGYCCGSMEAHKTNKFGTVSIKGSEM